MIKRASILLVAWAALVGLAWWQAYHRDLARCRGNSGWLYGNCVDTHSLVRDNILLAGVALPLIVVAAVMILQWHAQRNRHRSTPASGTITPKMPKAIRDTFYGRSADAP